MTEDLIVSPAEAAQLYCAWGLRKWWREHELDFADFLKNGIQASTLLATEDPLAVRLVEHAKANRGILNE